MHLTGFLGTCRVIVNLLLGTQWEKKTESTPLQGALHPVGAREVNTHYKAGC